MYRTPRLTACLSPSRLSPRLSVSPAAREKRAFGSSESVSPLALSPLSLSLFHSAVSLVFSLFFSLSRTVALQTLVLSFIAFLFT